MVEDLRESMAKLELRNAELENLLNSSGSNAMITTKATSGSLNLSQNFWV